MTKKILSLLIIVLCLLVLPLAFAVPVEVLVVAGGGSGGNNYGGGGGGGGYIYNTSFDLIVGSYNITVGAGGLGTTTAFARGIAGGNSFFGNLTVNHTAIGGGGGGGRDSVGGQQPSGTVGGSGGGAAGDSGTAGVGTSGQGFAGGLGQNSGTFPGGGGGGALAVGAAGVTNGGKGGNEVNNSITGVSVSYSGGGGGGAGTAVGLGAINAGNGTLVGTGTTRHAVNATGAGGGGGGSTNGNGGNGGNGIVVVRYVTGLISAVGGTITTSGGYTIHTFLSNSTLTVNATTLSITAKDFYTNTSLSNFSALISQGNDTLGYQPFSNNIAWYKLDDNSNNTNVLDSSGNGNTGVLSGSSTTLNVSAAGQINRSFTFNGTVVLVNTTITSNAAFNNAFTLHAWINPADFGGSGAGRIIDKAEGSSAQNGFAFYVLNTNARLRLNVNTTAVNSGINSVTLNQWQHVAVTVSSSGLANFYINGTLSGTADQSVGALTKINTTNAMIFGQRVGGSDRAFNGSIDDVRIYNSSLSATDIYQLFQAGAYRIYNYSTTTGTIDTRIPLNSGLYNVTLNSTENGGYFNRAYSNYNFSSNIAAEIAQSIVGFLAYEKYTGNLIPSANFTSAFLRNNTHYMRIPASNYSINVSGTGYYSSNLSVMPIIFSSTVFNSTLYNATLNVSLRTHYTNVSVSNFTINLYNALYGVNETYYTTTGNFLFNITNNINYTISINATNYLDNVSYSFQTNNATNYTVYAYQTNKLYAQFLDEETLLPLLNVTYSLISSTYAINGTTTTGFISLENLSTGEYELRYTPTNYVARSSYIVFPLASATETNLTLYSLLNSTAFVFTLYVTDKYDLPQAGLKVSVLRRYPINGQTTYYVVEQMKPSYALNGQTTFSAVANNVAYLFRVETADGEVVFQGSGTTSSNLQTLYLISNPIYIRVTLDTNPFTVAQNMEGVSSNLTNTTNTFWFSVQDSASVLTSMCLKVIGNTSKVVSDQCTSPGNILSYIAPNGNNLSYYTAYGYVVIDGVNTVLKTAQIDYRNNTSSRTYGAFGLFLALISIITISVAFADKPQFMVIGIAVVLLTLGTQALGFIWLSPILQGTVFVLAIIVAYIMRND